MLSFSYGTRKEAFQKKSSFASVFPLNPAAYICTCIYLHFRSRHSYGKRLVIYVWTCLEAFVVTSRIANTGQLRAPLPLFPVHHHVSPATSFAELLWCLATMTSQAVTMAFVLPSFVAGTRPRSVSARLSYRCSSRCMPTMGTAVSSRFACVPMVRFSRAPGFGAVEELDLFLRRPVSAAAVAAAAAAAIAGLGMGGGGGAGRPSPKLAPRVAYAPVVEIVDEQGLPSNRVVIHRSFDAF